MYVSLLPRHLLRMFGIGLMSLPVVQVPVPAGEIHGAPDDPAVEVGVAALREHLDRAPFAAFDYYLGETAASAAGPLADGAALAPEGFELKPFEVAGRRAISIQAPTTAGLALGVLRLVRNGLANPETFAQQPIRMRPDVPIREMYEEHGWDDPAALESYKSKLRIYLREGFNCVDVPFGWFIPPVEDVKDAEAYRQKWATHYQTLREVIDYAHSLGIQVYLVENPQFNPYFSIEENIIKPERLVPPMPERTAKGLDIPLLLCTSIEANRELIRRHRRMLYRELPAADGIVVYFNDPGGCTCDACADWGATILRVCRELYEPLLAEAAPQYKMRLSLWGTSREASSTVAEGLATATPVITDLQIPPTSPTPPYLTTDAVMIDALTTASQQRPIILQQFYDGVGFKNGWVNMIEHPMPRLMEQSQRLSLRQAKLSGVYGSAFEFNTQQIDARLTGEWGWDLERSADEILTEMGNERFGAGTGPDFTAAVLAMEEYWDGACIQFFSDGAPDNAARAAAAASRAADKLARVAPRVERNREFFEGLAALARAMELTTRQQALRQQAAELVAQQQGDKARGLLTEAQEQAREITRLLSSGYFAYMPKLGWWGQDWVIGRRAAIIESEIALSDPQRWEPTAEPAGDFLKGKWEAASPGTGRVTFADTAEGAQADLDNRPVGTEWTGLVSAAAELPANATYRIECEVRWMDGATHNNALLAQWVEANGFGEGTRSYINAPADGGWHPVAAACITPTLKAGAKTQLRFLMVGEGPHAQVRNVRISRQLPERRQ